MAGYISTESQQNRLRKGATHPFLLLHMSINRDSSAAIQLPWLSFDVLSCVSQNQYQVSLHSSNGCSCSCPDHSQSGTPVCKHIIFILTRRLGWSLLDIPPARQLQKHQKFVVAVERFAQAVSKAEELQARFSPLVEAKASGSEDALPETALPNAVDSVGAASFTRARPPVVVKRARDLDLPVILVLRKRPYTAAESCCFCLEDYSQCDLEKNLAPHQWCSSCENLWHPDCFDQYVKAAHGAVTCPFCRTALCCVCAPV